MRTEAGQSKSSYEELECDLCGHGHANLSLVEYMTTNESVSFKEG